MKIKKFNFTASVSPQSSIFIMTAINKNEVQVEEVAKVGTRDRIVAEWVECAEVL